MTFRLENLGLKGVAIVASAVGTHVGNVLWWHEVSAVHARWEHGAGVMPRKPTVTIFGSGAGAKVKRIQASGRFVDIGPLLAEVADQIARRPGLLVSDEDSKGMAEIMAIYGLR